MSAVSAAFSSSSRSIRSISDLSRSAAMPPPLVAIPLSVTPLAGRRTISARACDGKPKTEERLVRAVLVLAGAEGLELVGRSLLLVARLPFAVGHAVDDLARRVVADGEATLAGRGPVPFRQAVAAEAREVHQVDVLNVGA